MKHRIVIVTLAAISVSLRVAATDEGWFLPLDTVDAYGSVKDLSSDGTVGVGIDGGALFRWTNTMGSTIEYLPDTDVDFDKVFTARISDDGMTIVANQYSTTDGAWSAAYWREAEGWTVLGGLPYGTVVDGSTSTGWGVNGDGSIVVGMGWVAGSRGEGFRWTAAEGMIGLGRPADRTSRATEISADGSVTVGYWQRTGGDRAACRWFADGSHDLFLGENDESEANNVSADGTFIVGKIWNVAFIFDDTNGLQELGILRPTHDRSVAGDLSDDGRRVVGWSGNPFSGTTEAFLWTPENGIKSLDEVLAEAGIDMSDWTTLIAYSISGDGQTIVGTAFNTTDLRASGFVAFLPRPIFSNGFESGDLEAWSSAVGDM